MKGVGEATYTGSGEGPSAKIAVNDISALFQFTEEGDVFSSAPR